MRFKLGSFKALLSPPSIGIRSRLAGFSLIEIILALGIISFALVGILGLFPVAVDAAKNSQNETQAALIARSIFDQLEATPQSIIRTIVLSKKYKDSSSLLSVDLTKANNNVGPIPYTTQGEPLSSAGDPLLAYIAQISVVPMPSPSFDLSQVVVTVRPVSSKTTSYMFATILRQK